MLRVQREAQLPAWISDKPSQTGWPSHIDGIELVWHRLNRPQDLRLFLASNVGWAECDARMEPAGIVVASHTPGTRGGRALADWLADVAASGRAAKIDLKEGGPVLDGVLAAVKWSKIRGRALWFNVAVDVIGGRKGFKRLANAYRRARISTPVDQLAPWLLVSDEKALDLLSESRTWGVDRLSISVQTQSFYEIVRLLSERGWETNVGDVMTRAQLNDALALRPTSITADLGVLAPTDAEPLEPASARHQPPH
jgi:hypothetical protein